MSVRQQVAVSVMYKGVAPDGQRLNLLVEPGAIVEIKAVERLAPIHQAQLISYPKTRPGSETIVPTQQCM